MGWVGLLARGTGSRRYWDSEERWRKKQAKNKAGEKRKKKGKKHSKPKPPQEEVPFHQQPNPDYGADVPNDYRWSRSRPSRTSGRDLPPVRATPSHPRSTRSHSHPRSTSAHPHAASSRPRSSQAACNSPTPEEYLHELKHHRLSTEEKELLEECKANLQEDLRPALDRYGGDGVGPQEMQATARFFARFIYQRELNAATQVEWKSDKSKRSGNNNWSLITVDPMTSVREDSGGQSRGDKILSAALLRTLTPVVLQHFCMGGCGEKRHQEAWQEMVLSKTVVELERFAVKKAKKLGLFHAKIAG